MTRIDSTEAPAGQSTAPPLLLAPPPPPTPLSAVPAPASVAAPTPPQPPMPQLRPPAASTPPLTLAPSAPENAPNPERTRPAPAAVTISRVVAAVITAAIGIASFAVCFPAQYELASRAASIPSHLAWLWPVIIDATMVQAAVSALALSADPTAHRRPRRYFWAVLVIAALVGIGFLALDAVTATGDTINPWLDAALAGVAPVALVASTRGLALLIRARHTPIATTTHPR